LHVGGKGSLSEKGEILSRGRGRRNHPENYATTQWRILGREGEESPESRASRRRVEFSMLWATMNSVN